MWHKSRAYLEMHDRTSRPAEAAGFPSQLALCHWCRWVAELSRFAGMSLVRVHVVQADKFVSDVLPAEPQAASWL